MKRQAITLAEIAEHGNLVLAAWKAARGKRTRPSVARFLADFERQIARLAESIVREQAPLGRSSSFTLYDPQQRTIHAACFADRVL